MYFLTVSVRKDSNYRLTGSSAQNLTEIKVSARDAMSSGALGTLSSSLDVGGIRFLVVVCLRSLFSC